MLFLYLPLDTKACLIETEMVYLFRRETEREREGLRTQKALYYLCLGVDIAMVSESWCLACIQM